MNSMIRHRKTHCQNAFTLIELLVALTIASALTAIALPTLKDSMRQNTLSRSASLVKGAFINARAQAIRTGRPFGLVIERRQRRIGEGVASGLNFFGANYATRIYYVQSPIEYRGDSQNAQAYPYLSTAWAPNPAPPANQTLPNSVIAKFFIPLESAGVLYAAVNGSAPARRLIGDGTRFSIGGSDYNFELDLTRSRTITAAQASTLGITPAVPGSLIIFNYRSIAPERSSNPGVYTNAIATSQFPARLELGQGYSFKFQTNPIKAPLAPVTMIGKTVVDLSISGTGSEPLLFNAQNILDTDPANVIPALDPDSLLQDVVVMFAPDGRLDGVFSSRRDPSISAPQTIPGFYVERLDPSTTVAFNVGFVDGILDNIDDGARYPYAVPGTDPQINTDDPPLESLPPWPNALTPKKVPNFANSDCAWISIHPLSGAISLDTVAGQPPQAKFYSYYGFSTANGSQSARNVIRERLHQSRRLTTAGTTQ
ncbi:hypothetical protein Mal15_35090 [Stieleria maiorica]|uniref:Uncharacterized protein n=2 Tax=Stieleria maiorica TaxID=2795974 RepID=A0A5B9MIG4_9BACT|nr:hypothetical protein Mal15_35090 [Stieleria maiorica]